MKIDGKPMFPIENVKATNRMSKGEKKSSVSEADKVAVSDKAQVFQALLQKVKELPAVREERVLALTEQIERGEYKIDEQKIAEKLISPE